MLGVSTSYKTLKVFHHILARSLYTDREIFLRELVSNACDALNRMQFEMLTNRIEAAVAPRGAGGEAL